MIAGPCRQTKDGPECSGPPLARRPIESRAKPGLFSQDNHVSAVFALTSSVVNELEEQSNHVSAVFLLISSASNEL